MQLFLTNTNDLTSAELDWIAQQGAIWDFVFDMALRLAADIRAGRFDADGPTRREAEGLLEEMTHFYGSLVTA